MPSARSDSRQWVRVSLEKEIAMIQRFFVGPWLLAFVIAGPIAYLLVIFSMGYWLVRGDIGGFLLWLFFGWIFAAIAAAVIAIPFGLAFTSIKVMWEGVVWWWNKLPFTLSRKEKRS